MHLSTLGWVSLGLGLIIALARTALVVFMGRKRRSECSTFGSFLVLGSLIYLVSVPVYFYVGCHQYFYLYWVLGFLYLALEFGVIYELVVNVLKPYSALIDLGKVLFTWALLFLLIAASITAFTTTGPQPSKLDAAVAVMERSLRLIECGILLLFFFFEKRLSLSWRNPNVAIALGLGVTAAADLMRIYVSAKFPSTSLAWQVGFSIVFIGVLAVWFYTLVYQPQQQKTSALDSPSRLIFQRWDESLVSFGFGPAPANTVDSFIPSVERTVDRVLARKLLQ